MEIVIPGMRQSLRQLLTIDLDDDDDLTLPSFGKAAFGGTPTGSPGEMSDSMSSHKERSFSPEPSRQPFSSTLPRPGGALAKSGLSHSASAHDLSGLDPPAVHRMGKLSNGSATSLATHMLQQSGSGSGLLGARKGSFASLKNVFKSGEKMSAPPPPVPSWDTKPGAGPGYPTLKNPFSMAPPPSPPPNAPVGYRPRANTKASMSSAFHFGADRNRSVATMHSSQRSLGARSTRSEASSTFRAEDYPLPAMPRIPNRSTPSRAGRQGSDTSMFGTGYAPPKASMSGDDFDHFGKTPAEEALRVVFQEFREAAERKIKKLLAKPLVGVV